MIRSLIVFVLLLPTAAFAQGASLDDRVEALNGKLIAEFNAGLQCATAYVGLQKQLAAVTKERDELKAKLEAKPGDNGDHKQ